MKNSAKWSLLFLTACTGPAPVEQPEETPAIYLSFDGRDQTKIKDLPDGDSVLVGSIGGDLLEAVEASKLLVSKYKTVRVKGFCLSACAEILTRVASSQGALEIDETTLVGFHHNPIIFIESSLPEDRPYGQACLAEELAEMRAAIELVNGADNISKSQMDKLGYLPGSVQFSADCNNTYNPPPIKYWFPTSEQLRTSFGFDFRGSLCADDIDCFKETWGPLTQAGDAYLVGDRELFVSEVSEGQVVWSE